MTSKVASKVSKDYLPMNNSLFVSIYYFISKLHEDEIFSLSDISLITGQSKELLCSMEIKFLEYYMKHYGELRECLF